MEALQILLGLVSLVWLASMLLAGAMALGAVGMALLIIMAVIAVIVFLLPVILPALGAAGYMDAKGSKEWAQAIRNVLKVGAAVSLTLATSALPIYLFARLCASTMHNHPLVIIVVGLFFLGWCGDLMSRCYSFWWRAIKQICS